MSLAGCGHAQGERERAARAPSCTPGAVCKLYRCRMPRNAQEVAPQMSAGVGISIGLYVESVYRGGEPLSVRAERRAHRVSRVLGDARAETALKQPKKQPADERTIAYIRGWPRSGVANNSSGSATPLPARRRQPGRNLPGGGGNQSGRRGVWICFERHVSYGTACMRSRRCAPYDRRCRSVAQPCRCHQRLPLARMTRWLPRCSISSAA